MSKRRRGVRDTRPPQDERRPFAASGSDAVPLEGAAEEAGLTAGQMLRAMREAAGIDAALVASALKVAPQKIDALEGERYDELPDVTFARGLAAAFCRAFGADPAPVLARMPTVEPGLYATGNANQPMQGGSGMGSEASLMALPKPLLWIVAALLLLALLIWFLPAQPDNPSTSTVESVPLPAPAIVEPEHTVLPAPALPASEAEAAASAASEAASAAAQPASASSQAAASTKLLGVEALESVWVEVQDANERVLVSRTIAKGQRVDVDSDALPLSVKVGRRGAVRVTVRGKPYDLAKTGGSGAVARFQVK